jgi:hypothetical protein
MNRDLRKANAVGAFAATLLFSLLATEIALATMGTLPVVMAAPSGTQVVHASPSAS